MMRPQVLAKWFIALAYLTSAAQAAVPLASPDLDRQAKQAAPTSTTALLWVYRSSTDARTELPVYVNGGFMARTEPGTFMLFLLRPGQNVITSDGRSQDALIVNVQGGRKYYVQQSAHPAGPGRSSFRLVSPAAAQSAIAGSRLIDVRAAQAAAAAAKPPPVAARPKPGAPTPAKRELPQPAKEAPKVSIALRTGIFRMSSTSQTLAGVASTFDRKAASVFSLDTEYRPISDFGVGLEILGYRNDLTGATSASGDMNFSSVFANVRKLFAASPNVYPFIGAGIGAVGTKFSGNVITGNATGTGAQLMLGVELHMGSAMALLEVRQISARTKDGAGNRVDASGRGVFAGIGLRF